MTEVLLYGKRSISRSAVAGNVVRLDAGTGYKAGKSRTWLCASVCRSRKHLFPHIVTNFGSLRLARSLTPETLRCRMLAGWAAISPWVCGGSVDVVVSFVRTRHVLAPWRTEFRCFPLCRRPLCDSRQLRNGSPPISTSNVALRRLTIASFELTSSRSHLAEAT